MQVPFVLEKGLADDALLHKTHALHVRALPTFSESHGGYVHKPEGQRTKYVVMDGLRKPPKEYRKSQVRPHHTGCHLPWPQ